MKPPVFAGNGIFYSDLRPDPLIPVAPGAQQNPNQAMYSQTQNLNSNTYAMNNPQ